MLKESIGHPLLLRECTGHPLLSVSPSGTKTWDGQARLKTMLKESMGHLLLSLVLLVQQS